MNIDDLRNLNWREAGSWPLLPKMLVLSGILVLIVAAGAWFDWKDQWDSLDSARSEEV